MLEALGTAIFKNVFNSDQWGSWDAAGGLLTRKVIREMIKNPSSRLIWPECLLSPCVYNLQIAAVRDILDRIYNDPQKRDLEVREAWLKRWGSANMPAKAEFVLAWYDMPDRRRARRA